MSSIGWMNPCPFVIGGDTTDIEDAWRAMRAMVGGEHGPGPENGIEDLARQVKAERIAFAERAVERAFLQNFPEIASDALPVWEQLLLTDGAVTPVDLRALLALAWQAPEGGTTPSLTDDLQAISSQLSIAIEDPDVTIVTEPSKYFAPEDDLPPYGLTSPPNLTSAVLPNYATRDILRVVYTLDDDAGELEIPDIVTRDVEKLLQQRLASWETWTLTAFSAEDGAGFFLDGGAHGASLLDVTAFG